MENSVFRWRHMEFGCEPTVIKGIVWVGVPLVFCSECWSNPNCLHTHTTPFSEHDLFVRCWGFTTPYRRPIHRKSRDLRSGWWDMSIFCCCFPILGCVSPLINGQASSPRRPSYWRRCPTVAWFARSQACCVLTVLTNFWCCVSNLLWFTQGRIIGLWKRVAGSRREPRARR